MLLKFKHRSFSVSPAPQWIILQILFLRTAPPHSEDPAHAIKAWEVNNTVSS